MNQHYFDVPFAFSGDVTPIPDPLQTGGTVSFTEGWNYNYQRDLATDPAALPIDRSTTNWLLLQITTALQALQQQGAPEFILASQNGGTPYSYGQGAVVLWSSSGVAPFTKFVSIVAGNTNTPSAVDPLGATTGWQVVCDPIATSAQAAAGTNNASIMTPSLVAQQTALRALLAGNASQVFNVANATSASQAVALGQVPSGGTTGASTAGVWLESPGGIMVQGGIGVASGLISTFTYPKPFVNLPALMAVYVENGTGSAATVVNVSNTSTASQGVATCSISGAEVMFMAIGK